MDFGHPAYSNFFFDGTQSFRGSAQISGIFSNPSPVTKAFNIPSLEAERSINLSGGFVSKLSNTISLTVDAYWIQIKNRVVLSGVFDREFVTGCEFACEIAAKVAVVFITASQIHKKTITRFYFKTNIGRRYGAIFIDDIVCTN